MFSGVFLFFSFQRTLGRPGTSKSTESHLQTVITKMTHGHQNLSSNQKSSQQFCSSSTGASAAASSVLSSIAAAAELGKLQILILSSVYIIFDLRFIGGTAGKSTLDLFNSRRSSLTSSRLITRGLSSFSLPLFSDFLFSSSTLVSFLK